jgi:thiamine-phosphate pyrophosphorylase
MPLDLKKPIIYLITSGQTSPQTTPASEDFFQVLSLIEAAVTARIELVQIREKNLNSRVLFQLAATAAKITRESSTLLLINDRSDIASAAGADGVHLTTRSLPAAAVRNIFGEKFLIGVSTHSLTEALAARESGANFIVFGPIFDTPAKSSLGNATGLDELSRVIEAVSPLPVLALGGITIDKVGRCLQAGAQGVAAIRMLSDAEQLNDIVAGIRGRSESLESGV